MIIAFGLLVILISSLIQGLTSFGFSLIAVPLLVLIISPKTIVPLMIIHSLFLNIYLIYACRKDINLKKILPLIIAGIIGIPFGAHLLKILSPDVLKILIGLIITFFAVLFLLGIRKEVKKEAAAFIPIGLISGVLNGSISMSGPPVILFFSNQGVKKNQFRANLVSYFLILNLFSIPVFIINGLLTRESLLYSAYFFPALTIGAILGNMLAHRIPENRFRQIALIVVLLSGILSLFSGLNII